MFEIFVEESHLLLYLRSQEAESLTRNIVCPNSLRVIQIYHLGTRRATSTVEAVILCPTSDKLQTLVPTETGQMQCPHCILNLFCQYRFLLVPLLVRDANENEDPSAHFS